MLKVTFCLLSSLYFGAFSCFMRIYLLFNLIPFTWAIYNSYVTPSSSSWKKWDFFSQFSLAFHVKMTSTTSKKSFSLTRELIFLSLSHIFLSLCVPFCLFLMSHQFFIIFQYIFNFYFYVRFTIIIRFFLCYHSYALRDICWR